MYTNKFLVPYWLFVSRTQNVRENWPDFKRFGPNRNPMSWVHHPSLIKFHRLVYMKHCQWMFLCKELVCRIGSQIFSYPVGTWHSEDIRRISMLDIQMKRLFASLGCHTFGCLDVIWIFLKVSLKSTIKIWLYVEEIVQEYVF